MSTWLERAAAAIEAGEKPAYADVEEGLFQTTQKMVALEETLKQVGAALASIVAPRILDDTPGVLAAVDAVIKKNVVVKQHQDKASMH